MLEFFEQSSHDGLVFTCLDQDAKAIAYAARLCTAFSDRITFTRSPILRFSSTKRFTLVWCAGVFDYLDDRLFIITLKRLLRLVAEGGQVVLGNFSTDNPTRPIMEFGGWNLYHRSEEDLFSLATLAGIAKSQITIGSEPKKVNVFLHIRKGS